MKRIGILLVGMMILAACSPSKTPVKELEKLAERMDNHSQNWTAADWDDAAVYLAELNETLARYDYEPQEKEYIDSLRMHCLVMVMRGM